MNTKYEEYLEYKAESQACGYEIKIYTGAIVESYKEWCGEESLRDKAESKWQVRNERDELDLY